MKILAIDPGKSTGLCYFNTEKETPVVWMHTSTSRQALVELLCNDLPETEVVVIEDYINRPKQSGGFDHTWDKGFTHRVIGSIEAICIICPTKIVFQQPYDKKPTCAQLGLGNYDQLKRTKKASIHQIDAMLHGYKYILDHNLIPKSRVLGSLESK